MSKTRIVVLGLAIGSAILAAYLAKGFIGKKPRTEVVEVNTVATVPVLVAKRDVLMGEKLLPGSIDWQPWPEKAVTETMITQKNDPAAQQKYEAARARIAIFRGEPIIDKKVVMPTESGFMAAILPKGMRAIAVRVSEESGAGGFILPNDRVDVVLTRKVEADGTTKVVVSETILSNVKVLAIDQAFRREGDDEQVIVAKKTATLELTPQQSEVISMAESTGQLSLVLRSIAENGDKGLDDTGPQLSEKYAQGAQGNDKTYIKYGVEKRITDIQ
ncbi:MAG: Flp pilus assembly protein CpaB [Rhizobiales bacterium]|nr:Flp pilus assembly protein CpaB [Hyphomicrobiales bacterium]